MLKKALILGLGLMIKASFAGSADDVSMITQRHHPEAFMQSIQHDPAAGKKIYQQVCSTCHAKNPSVDVGAPQFRVERDWRGRMKKGLEGMLTVTTAGLNQMPPRGGCFECSDAQLKAAIAYMLPKKIRK